MKVLLLYHMKEREEIILRLIEKEIKRIQPNTDTVIMPFDGGFEVTLEFKPDVILTYPIRDAEGGCFFTAVKLLLKTKIISLTTEGLENFDDPTIVEFRIGTFEFSEKLVDYFFYWGVKPADIFRKSLLHKRLVSSGTRVGISGYVMYEQKAVMDYVEEIKNNIDILLFQNKYEKLIVFVTGFGFPDDPIADALEGSIFPACNTKEEYECAVNEVLMRQNYNISFAQKYLEIIMKLVSMFPQHGFIVKLHPVEVRKVHESCRESYELLRKCSNVLILDRSVPILEVLQRSDLLFHYGSTTALEAYICRIPSVCLRLSAEGEGLHYTFGANNRYPSTKEIYMNDEAEIIKCITDDLKFLKLPEVEKFIKETFDYSEERAYSPTNVIASQVLYGEPVQIIGKHDPRVLATLKNSRMLSVKWTLYKSVCKNFKCRNFSKGFNKLRMLNTIQPNFMYYFIDLFNQTIIHFKSKRKG